MIKKLKRRHAAKDTSHLVTDEMPGSLATEGIAASGQRTTERMMKEALRSAG